MSKPKTGRWPTIYDKDGGALRTVKNLGWLLRHWKEVAHFTVSESDLNGFDAKLVALLGDGRQYEAYWASRHVLRSWLQRPVFRGATLTWFGNEETC
jgi:hypothetical protein